MKKSSSFETWLAYWKSTIPWPASPEACEVWSGALDYVCLYLENNCLNNITDDKGNALVDIVRSLKEK